MADNVEIPIRVKESLLHVWNPTRFGIEGRREVEDESKKEEKAVKNTLGPRYNSSKNRENNLM